MVRRVADIKAEEEREQALRDEHKGHVPKQEVVMSTGITFNPPGDLSATPGVPSPSNHLTSPSFLPHVPAPGSGIWFRVESPGTKDGPCNQASCGHGNCLSARVLAGSACGECGGPIGFGEKFVLDGGVGLPSAVFHPSCWKPRPTTNPPQVKYAPSKTWKARHSPMRLWYASPGPSDARGACRDACHHGNCASMRWVASAICHICRFPIGYYRETVFGDGLAVFHRACWEVKNTAEGDRDAR